MALLNKLSAAGELGGSILKKMFTGLFEGDKKRTVTSSRTAEPLKEGATEMEAFAHAVRETNQILNESIDLQKTQNATLADILELLKNYKPGTSTDNKSWTDWFSDLFDMAGDKKPSNKPNAKLTNKPNINLGSAVRAFSIQAPLIGAVALGNMTSKAEDTQIQKMINREQGKGVASPEQKYGKDVVEAARKEFQPWYQFGRGYEEDQEKWVQQYFEKYSDKKQNTNVKVEGGTKETSAQIIEFNARDIKFTAKDMLIRADEIKINGQVQQTSIPAGPGGGATPSVLGVTPTTPGSTASANGATGLVSLTTITSKSGNSTKVGATYAPNFQSFIDDLEATGYKITSLGGYANRANANNPNVKSYHAMGAAIDINPASNPNRSTKTDLPQETGALAAKHGLGWGMNWKSVKDPMHFSAAKSEQGSFDVQRGSMTGYASGTDYVPESGPAIVGEKGPELIMSQDGSSRLTGDGPHAENLQQGDSVLPADKTKEVLPDASKMGVVPGTKYPTRAPAKHYVEGTNKAVMDLNQRYSEFGGAKVERSGSYMSRPHFYDTEDKLYAAMGERTSKQPYTDKDDMESYETIEAFRRGEKPEKPAGMTQREYLTRMSEHGAMGLLTGAIKPEELQKANKQAEQPLWMTKAQNKTEAMVKSVEGVRGPNGEKLSVKPLFAPAETDVGKFSAMDYVEPKAPPPPMPEPAPVREMSDEEMRNQAWRDRGRAMGGRPNAYIPPPGGMGSPSGDLLKAYLTSGQ